MKFAHVGVFFLLCIQSMVVSAQALPDKPPPKKEPGGNTGIGIPVALQPPAPAVASVPPVPASGLTAGAKPTPTDADCTAYYEATNKKHMLCP